MWGVQLQVVHVEIEAVHIGGFMVSFKKEMRCIRLVALKKQQSSY